MIGTCEETRTKEEEEEGKVTYYFSDSFISIIWNVYIYVVRTWGSGPVLTKYELEVEVNGGEV